MKTIDSILDEIAQLRQNMCSFLSENRAANQSLGLPPVGPAAKSIETALEDLNYAFKQIVRPKKTKKVKASLDERAEKDIKLGAKPLAEAKCDECNEHAFTRYYADHGTRRESIAYTVCAKHDEELWERNRRDRARLGLDR
jgi:hypothetical protein